MRRLGYRSAIGRGIGHSFEFVGGGANVVARREQDGAVDGVLELAHVAVPRMGVQHLACLGRQRAFGNAVGLAEAVNEVLGQLVDVERALAQAGQAQIDDIEAEEQILAESSALDLLLEVTIGRGDQADIDVAGAFVADPLEITLLQHAQQLALQLQRDLADLVEKQRAAVGEFEAANNVKFKPKYYAGGDNMLALIAQSPPGTYDVILSDAEFVQQLNAAGYIEELNAADYPFDDMVHEDFKKFPGHWKDGKLYSVMLRFGLLGVSYNTKAVSDAEAASYKCFWKPELKGKVGHFDWHLPNLGQISLYNGNGKNLWNLDKGQWDKVKATAKSQQATSVFLYRSSSQPSAITIQPAV